MDKYVEYPGQFDSADLSDAYELLNYCMAHNIIIEISELPRPDLIADLLIVKCREISKYEIE